MIRSPCSVHWDVVVVSVYCEKGPRLASKHKSTGADADAGAGADDKDRQVVGKVGGFGAVKGNRRSLRLARSAGIQTPRQRAGAQQNTGTECARVGHTAHTRTHVYTRIHVHTHTLTGRPGSLEPVGDEVVIEVGRGVRVSIGGVECGAAATRRFTPHHRYNKCTK